MKQEIKIFPLKGISDKGMKNCIKNTLIKERLYSPNLLYRIFTAKRIPIVQSTGNDRYEKGFDSEKLERELEPGYDLAHTLWASELDHLCDNGGRNQLLLSAISVYDTNKTKTLGGRIYHIIETEDPKDALVAIFKRSNSSFLHIAGKANLLFTQGPVALLDSLVFDYENIKEYFLGREK